MKKRFKIIEEERSQRLDIQFTQLTIYHELYVSCFQVRMMRGNLEYLTKELYDLRDRLAFKQTQTVGTDPPHHPIARSVIPLERLPNADVLAGQPGSSNNNNNNSNNNNHIPTIDSPTNPERLRFSPQRYRAPGTRKEAKSILTAIEKYIQHTRTQPSRIPCPAWVVEAPGLKVPDPASVAVNARQGPIELALGHFLQELQDAKAAHEVEVKNREKKIEQLSKQVQLATLSPDDLNAKFKVYIYIHGFFFFFFFFFFLATYDIAKTILSDSCNYSI